MTNDLILYALIGAGLLGSALGVFVQKLFVAVLAPIPLVVAPTGVAIALRPYLERNPLVSGELRDALIEIADPAVLLQMTLACIGGVLAGHMMARLASRSETPALRAATPTNRLPNVKTRVAAVAKRTALQKRTERIAATFGPSGAVAPQPIYDVGTSGGGLVSASSVASRLEADLAENANLNRRARTRRRAILAGFLLLDDGRSCPCRIVDVSDTGARVRLPTLMPLPDRLWLLNTSDWQAHEVSLAWRKDAEAGLRYLSKRDLRNPTTERDRAMHALCANLTAR